MFLSLLFASPSRLICLSRQTHQQLFFRGDRLLNTLHTLEEDAKKTKSQKEFHWKRRNQLKIINYLAPKKFISYFFLSFSPFAIVRQSLHFRVFVFTQHFNISMFEAISRTLKMKNIEIKLQSLREIVGFLSALSSQLTLRSVNCFQGTSTKITQRETNN